MANVEIVGYVKIGNRTFKLKKSPFFLSRYVELFIEGTAVQLRLLSYGIRDYIIDKILAMRPSTGKLVVRRLPQKNEEPSEPEEQRLYEWDPLVLRKVIPLPPRESDPATVARVPFIVRPLSKPYLKKKVRQKLDPRTFISSGDYLRGIVVRKRKTPGAGVTYVVTVANRLHKVTGIRLHQLALILEFGTSSYSVPLFGDKSRMVQIRIPARPHWRPALEELKRLMLSIGYEIQARTLRRAIQELS